MRKKANKVFEGRGIYTVLLICVSFLAGSVIYAEPVHNSLIFIDPQALDSAEFESEVGFTTLATSFMPTDQDFQDWLSTWQTQEFNSFNLTPRDPRYLTRYWPNVSPEEQVTLKGAPFRILALVNRLDIGEDLGEFRVVYTAYNPENGLPLAFTLIFEYGIPSLPGLTKKSDWARRFLELEHKSGEGLKDSWLELARLIISDPNNLNQIRSNDFLLDFTWEMREFKMANGQLSLAPTAQTPDLSLEKSTALAHWIEENRDAVLAESARVPEPFLAGASLVPSDRFQWKTLTNDEALRHSFSMQTCNGCHSGETGAGFTHIKPRLRGVPSKMSAFLKSDLLRRFAALKSLGTDSPQRKWIYHRIH